MSRAALCLSLAVALWWPPLAAKEIYPWAEDVSADDRNQELLDALRESLQLDMVSYTPVDDRRRRWRLRNLDGTPFIADVVPVALQAQDGPLPPEQLQPERYDPDVLSSRLHGLCSLLPSDYWNYEWCHRKDVTQFHIEQHGQKFVRNPDWSLGKYDRTLVVRESAAVGDESVPILKIVDHYSGGQICHENNHRRSTEVHIQCCDDLQLPNSISSATYYAHERSNLPMPKATLSSIYEPELCSYKAIVCTPLLCRKDGNLGVESGEDLGRYVQVMHTINNSCLVRQEDWWTYELCFNKGVRQIRFNIEQSITSDGTIVQKQVMVNQFILGHPPLHMYENETALMEATSSVGIQGDLSISSRERFLFQHLGMLSPLFRDRGKQPNFLSLTFSDGTPCDLESVNRSSVIDMYCGPSNAITQVEEYGTCRYRLRVELPLLCALPGFQPPSDNVTFITLTAAEAEDDGATSAMQSLAVPQQEPVHNEGDVRSNDRSDNPLGSAAMESPKAKAPSSSPPQRKSQLKTPPRAPPLQASLAGDRDFSAPQRPAMSPPPPSQQHQQQPREASPHGSTHAEPKPTTRKHDGDNALSKEQQLIEAIKQLTETEKQFLKDELLATGDVALDEDGGQLNEIIEQIQEVLLHENGTDFLLRLLLDEPELQELVADEMLAQQLLDDGYNEHGIGDPYQQDNYLYDDYDDENQDQYQHNYEL